MFRISDKISIGVKNFSVEEVIDESIRKNTEDMIDSIEFDDKHEINNDLTGGANLKDLLKDVLTGGNTSKVVGGNTSKVVGGNAGGNTSKIVDENANESVNEIIEDNTTKIYVAGGNKAEESQVVELIEDLPLFNEDSDDSDDSEDNDTDDSDDDEEEDVEETRKKYKKFMEELKNTSEPIVFRGGNKNIDRTCKIINAFPYVLRSK